MPHTQPKKLIEVAMPIKEISAESVRDKSIRHGHISTLHLWWARRPLPVCRAVVFASLVPDPLDPNCPPAFAEAVQLLLGKPNNPGDPYAPYEDIPWTAVFDPMPENLRNRLQLFIGKFTPEMQQHLLHNKPKPAANNQLTNHSLIKWDNKNNPAILTKARQLIWVAHNAPQYPNHSAQQLIDSYNLHYQNIEQAEELLYSQPDRHLPTPQNQQLAQNLQNAINTFLAQMPRVFDPFAGGGAIPLEAARLGCHTFGNDINPVAHIIQKGSLEFPQKYGKPIVYTKAEFETLYGTPALHQWCTQNGIHPDAPKLLIEIPNRLAFDVDFYARKLLANTEAQIGHLYPANPQGNKPIAYYWARTGTCSNPSCRAQVPLLKQFYLANTDRKHIYLQPIINGNQIEFEIKKGKYNEEGWVRSRKLICPCCGSTTDTNELKRQSIKQEYGIKLLAVIESDENGKSYRLPAQTEIDIIQHIPKPEPVYEEIVKGDSRNLWVTLWGIETWGQLFSPRQLLAIQTLVAQLNLLSEDLKPRENDYAKAIVTFLSFIINKSADYNSSFCTWHPGREVIGHVFTKQAIPMVFDFPEVYPFTESSGGIYNMIDWITRYIVSECSYPFPVTLQNASSGDKEQFPEKYLHATVTDPPYYDAIAYADLSDFFYVWLKRTLGTVYPLNFGTPQTPKTEECTALKHHHHNNKEQAKAHFEDKLTQIFDAIEHQTAHIVSIMFAHQSTEAWTTLCNSILGARMNITGSWPVDTEMANRSLGLAGAVLASSVTVSARPALRQGYGEYKQVRQDIENKVAAEVELLYRLGFRGADLLTACFGQAVSVFGSYRSVEKADGSRVTVAELLEIARESAFTALLKGFDGDEYTKFYIGWLQLYGFVETDFDDAAKFSRVGLSINVSDLFAKNILLKKNNKQTLGNFEERMLGNKKAGTDATHLIIDQVHRAMHLYKSATRTELLQHLSKVALPDNNSFWRVISSLCELLPAGSNDHKQASELLANKENLLREAKNPPTPKAEQTELFE